MPDRGVGGVHALAAGPAGPVHVDPDLVLGDVDVVGLLDHRHHVHAGERGLPAALVVVLGDADHPVRAVLAAQRAVGVGRVDRERGGLDPGLFGVGGVVDLGRVAVPLRPAQVHAQQVLRPVGGVRAAGLGVDRDQRLPGVVLAGQQGPDLQPRLTCGSCAFLPVRASDAPAEREAKPETSRKGSINSRTVTMPYGCCNLATLL